MATPVPTSKPQSSGTGIIVALILLLALLGVRGVASGDVLAYGYPLAVMLCLGCGFIGGQLRASTQPVEGRLMAEKIRRDTDYGIVLNAGAGRYVNVPNPFRGTLVLGGAGAGKTCSIGEPFLDQFLQRGMCGIIYDFKFPVLAGAAQKSMLYAPPAHKKLIEKCEKGSWKPSRSRPTKNARSSKRPSGPRNAPLKSLTDLRCRCWPI